MAITVTVTREAFGAIKIIVTGLDGNGESSKSIQTIDLAKYFTAGKLPSRVAIQAKQTAGTTDTVSVTVEGAPEDISAIMEVLATAINADTNAGVGQTDYVHGAAFPTKQIRFIEIISGTVGAGNTLTVTVFIY